MGSADVDGDHLDEGERACFACPVGTYQPLRSKVPCQPCPVGKLIYLPTYLSRCLSVFPLTSYVRLHTYT